MLQRRLHRRLRSGSERLCRHAMSRKQLRPVSRGFTVLPHRRPEPDDVLLANAGLSDVAMVRARAPLKRRSP